MRYIIILFYSFALLACSHQNNCDQDKFLFYQNKAMVLVHEYNLDETLKKKDKLLYALKLLDSASYNCEKSYVIYADKGMIYYLLNDYPKSAAYFDSAHHLNELFIEAVVMKGKIMDKMRKDSLAKISYKKAYLLYEEKIKKDKKNYASAVINQAVILLLLNNSKDSVLNFINSKINATNNKKQKDDIKSNEYIIEEFNKENFINYVNQKY